MLRYKVCRQTLFEVKLNFDQKKNRDENSFSKARTILVILVRYLKIKQHERKSKSKRRCEYFKKKKKSIVKKSIVKKKHIMSKTFYNFN